MILILAIVIVFRPKILGPRETIDGVAWRYVVKDGKAVIEHNKRNFFNNRPAISVTTSGALEIPAKLGGYRVVGVGQDAFSGCKNLTSVAIPKSLTKVSGRPFLDTNIRTVNVAKGDVERVKSIAEDLGIRLNSEKTNFGSNGVKFVECDEFPSAIGE